MANLLLISAIMMLIIVNLFFSSASLELVMTYKFVTLIIKTCPAFQELLFLNINPT